jgi:ComF family protein
MSPTRADSAPRRRLRSLLPPLLLGRCQVCGQPANGERAGLCPACAGLLQPRRADHCPACGRLFTAERGASHLCGECLRLAAQDRLGRPRPWQSLNFYAGYDGLLRRLLLRFKFHNGLGLAAVLQELTWRAWQGRDRPDVVLPVPLHAARLRQRGFNQSLELARPLARRLGARLAPRAMARTRHTRPQMTLSGPARLSNLKGAFRADPGAVDGRRVLLVDDIMTTGSTLTEAAGALLKAGAGHVDALVLARTLEPGEPLNPHESL